MEEEEFEAIIEEVFNSLPYSAPEQEASEDPGRSESGERDRDSGESGKDHSEEHDRQGGQGC
jgi:hypothetical protein